MIDAPFTIREASWNSDRDALYRIRHTVFVTEQDVPPNLEWDGIDDQCRHALAVDDDDNAVGCGRLLADGHIGRMAVLRDWRGAGVGGALLDFLVEMAREAGHKECRLASQTHAMGFYARHGFTAEGGEFLDAGIPHREMFLKL